RRRKGKRIGTSLLHALRLACSYAIDAMAGPPTAPAGQTSIYPWKIETLCRGSLAFPFFIRRCFIAGFIHVQQWDRLWNSANMNVPLRNRDPNVRFAEPLVDRHVQVVDDFESVLETWQITAEHEVQAVVAKALKRRHGSGVFHNDGMGGADFEQQFADTGGVRAVGDADVDDDPVDLVRECPIEQPAGDKLPVGNDELLAVPVGDRRRAH